MSGKQPRADSNQIVTEKSVHIRNARIGSLIFLASFVFWKKQNTVYLVGLILKTKES
jgi:hypothetical protein